MKYAISENHRIVVSDALRNPSQKCYCQFCKNEVVVDTENGNPRFIHQNLIECDPFSSDWSDWHNNMQNRFKEENQEVAISLAISGEDFVKEARENNFYSYRKHYQYQNVKEMITITHRADVCLDGYVIKFQNGFLSLEEFNEQNWFYTRAGYKLIWIMNLTNFFNDGMIFNVGYWEDEYGDGEKFLWKNAKRFLADFIPQYRKEDIHLYFQIEDIDVFDEDDRWNNYMQKVVWARKENGSSNFRYFFTSFEIMNITQLIEYIQANPHKVKPSKIINLGFGFRLGKNVIEKKRIMSWLQIEEIDWNVFLWYLAEHFIISDYTKRDVTIKINSLKQRKQLYQIVQEFQNDVCCQKYNLEKTNSLYKTRHQGYQKNNKILERLAQA